MHPLLTVCWWIFIALGLFMLVGAKRLLTARTPEETRTQLKMMRICGALLLLCGTGCLVLRLL
jgi:hypothetical protein